MQPRFAPRTKIDNLSPLDQTARFKIYPLFTMLHWQFDAITNQWFAWQRLSSGASYTVRNAGQANARCIAPTRTGERAIKSTSTRGPIVRDHPAAQHPESSVQNHGIPTGDPPSGSQIQNWVILCLAMHTFQRQLVDQARVKHHISRLVYRLNCAGSPKQPG